MDIENMGVSSGLSAFHAVILRGMVESYIDERMRDGVDYETAKAELLEKTRKALIGGEKSVEN